MEDTNNINLEQGELFNKLQKKIKKRVNKEQTIIHEDNRFIREGLENLLDKNKLETTQTKKTQSTELAELNALKKELQTAIADYNKFNTDVTKANSDYIVRSDKTNPYLNKLTGVGNRIPNLSGLGYGGYVTNMGVFKPFPSTDIANSVRGKNGCPTQKIEITRDKYSTAMKQGSNMTSGQSCGNEGNVVLVNSLISNPTASKIGCYSNTGTAATPAMTQLSTNDTFESCMTKAATNNFQYFGLQGYNATTKTGNCLVSTSESSATQYGPPPKYSKIQIWSSNTAGNPGAALKVTNEGQLIIYKPDGTSIWSTPKVGDCVNGGKLNTSTLTATLASGCPGRRLPSIDGNEKIVSTYNSSGFPNVLNFPIKDIGDPDPTCFKTFNTTYQCGTSWKSGNIPHNAQNRNFLFDCSTEVNNCKFALILQDSGNLALIRNGISSIWSSNTTGKQKVANTTDYPMSKGKYGINLLNMGQTLNANDWLSNPSSNIMLTMLPDGNLVLYTFDNAPTCSVEGHGLENNVGLFKINETLNTSNIGKLGYVDEDAQLHEFPSSLTQLGSTYSIYNNVNNPAARNIGNPITATDPNTCMTACNNNPNCYGFVKTATNCYLKGNNIFPGTTTQFSNGTQLYTKNKSLKASASCNAKEVKFIDSVQWNNYKKGSAMTSSSVCGTDLMGTPEQQQLNAVKTRMSNIASKMTSKIQEIRTKQQSTLGQFDDNTLQILDDAENFLNIYNNMNQLSSTTGLEGFKTMDDADAMLRDSDLIVLQQNYTYMMWSMFAVGFVASVLLISK